MRLAIPRPVKTALALAAMWRFAFEITLVVIVASLLPDDEEES